MAIKQREKCKIKSVYLTEAQWHLLEKYAISIDSPTNWVVKNIIEEWIMKNNKLLKIKA